MPEEMTNDEIFDSALELCKQGGERGRAIFYNMCFMAEDDNPEFVKYIMETVLTKMPEKDREIVLYCLDEYARAKKIDLRKEVEGELEDAIRGSLLGLPPKG